MWFEVQTEEPFASQTWHSQFLTEQKKSVHLSGTDSHHTSNYKYVIWQLSLLSCTPPFTLLWLTPIFICLSTQQYWLRDVKALEWTTTDKGVITRADLSEKTVSSNCFFIHFDCVNLDKTKQVCQEISLIELELALFSTELSAEMWLSIKEILLQNVLQTHIHYCTPTLPANGSFTQPAYYFTFDWIFQGWTLFVGFQ